MTVGELIAELQKLPADSIAAKLLDVTGYSDLEPYEITSIESRSNAVYFKDPSIRGTYAELVVID